VALVLHRRALALVSALTFRVLLVSARRRRYPLRVWTILRTSQWGVRRRTLARGRWEMLRRALTMTRLSKCQRTSLRCCAHDSEKRKGSRGRRLPGEQLPAARARVDGKLRAKALRPHGYGKRHSKQGESESDSDDNQTQGRISQSHRLAGGLLGAAERREAGERGEQAGGRAAGVHAAQSKCDAAATAKARGLTLPRGDAMRYQWEMPLTGAALTGRRVMCYFPNASGWFDGVVVQHLGSSGYSIFYEEDDEHEDWELPDPELVFMCNSEADHTIPVSRDMLPHV